MESPRQVEAILKFGSKSTTYKYALLKAVVDYVIEHPTEDAVNGFHYISGIYLAKKFLRYYWPLWKHGIKQSSASRTALEGLFEEFCAKFSRFSEEGFSIESPASIIDIIEQVETATKLAPPYIKLLQDIRRTVIDMPVKHVRNVRGETAQLFTAYYEDYPLVNSDFNEIIRLGRRTIKSDNPLDSFLQLELAEKFFILISDRVYAELTELRFWLDSIITRYWSTECQGYMGDEFPYGDFFASLSRQLGERSPLKTYRELYKKARFDDFYTGKQLPVKFAVDHFLPWSRFPVNRFWNLVPTRAAINSKKSNKLVVLTDELRYKKIPQHLDGCLRAGGELVVRDVKATYQKFFKRDVPGDHGKQVEELRELVLKLYDNLDRVTVEKKLNLKELVA
ncbi:MAG: HNH endonuclease domain-containing protein [bacterium]